MVERTFGDVLRSELRNKGVSAAQLSRRSGVTKQHLSKLLNNERSTRTGMVTKPSVDTVHKIARGLGWDVNDALLAAGYAPKTLTRKPETIPELVEALAQLGIEAPQPYGGYPNDPDGEGYREVVERIWLDIQMVTNRLTKGRNRPTIQNLELSEIDIEAEIHKRKTS